MVAKIWNILKQFCCSLRPLEEVKFRVRSKKRKKQKKKCSVPYREDRGGLHHSYKNGSVKKTPLTWFFAVVLERWSCQKCCLKVTHFNALYLRDTAGNEEKKILLELLAAKTSLVENCLFPEIFFKFPAF